MGFLRPIHLGVVIWPYILHWKQPTEDISGEVPDFKNMINIFKIVLV